MIRNDIYNGSDEKHPLLTLPLKQYRLERYYPKIRAITRHPIKKTPPRTILSKNLSNLKCVSQTAVLNHPWYFMH